MLRQIQAKPLIHRLEAAAWEAAAVEWVAAAEVVESAAAVAEWEEDAKVAEWAAAVAEWAEEEAAEWVAVEEQAVAWAKTQKVKALKDR